MERFIEIYGEESMYRFVPSKKNFMEDLGVIDDKLISSLLF